MYIKSIDEQYKDIIKDRDYTLKEFDEVLSKRHVEHVIIREKEKEYE